MAETLGNNVNAEELSNGMEKAEKSLDVSDNTLAKMKDMEETIRKLQGKFEEAKKEKEELESEVEVLKCANSNLRNQSAEMKIDLDKETKKAFKNQDRLETAEASLKHAGTALQGTEERNSELINENANLRAALEQRTRRNAEDEKRIQAAEKAIEHARLELEAEQERVSRCEKLKAKQTVQAEVAELKVIEMMRQLDSERRSYRDAENKKHSKAAELRKESEGDGRFTETADGTLKEPKPYIDELEEAKIYWEAAVGLQDDVARLSILLEEKDHIIARINESNRVMKDEMLQASLKNNNENMKYIDLAESPLISSDDFTATDMYRKNLAKGHKRGERGHDQNVRQIPDSVDRHTAVENIGTQRTPRSLDQELGELDILSSDEEETTRASYPDGESKVTTILTKSELTTADMATQTNIKANLTAVIAAQTEPIRRVSKPATVTVATQTDFQTEAADIATQTEPEVAISKPLPATLPSKPDLEIGTAVIAAQVELGIGISQLETAAMTGGQKPSATYLLQHHHFKITAILVVFTLVSSMLWAWNQGSLALQERNMWLLANDKAYPLSDEIIRRQALAVLQSTGKGGGADWLLPENVMDMYRPTLARPFMPGLAVAQSH